MRSSKQFKVAAISDNANSFGLFGHILIDRFGEAWEVGRQRSYAGERYWGLGCTITVETWEGRPQWHKLGVELPRRLPDAPPLPVASLWKEEQPA